MRAYEDSLMRLGMNRVDALLIHDLDVRPVAFPRYTVLACVIFMYTVYDVRQCYTHVDTEADMLCTKCATRSGDGLFITTS